MFGERLEQFSFQDEKLVLRQEQKAVRSMVLEHSQNLANERARIFIQRKLERGYDEKDTDGDHDSDIDLARMTTEVIYTALCMPHFHTADIVRT